MRVFQICRTKFTLTRKISCPGSGRGAGGWAEGRRRDSTLPVWFLSQAVPASPHQCKCPSFCFPASFHPRASLTAPTQVLPTGQQPRFRLWNVTLIPQSCLIHLKTWPYRSSYSVCIKWVSNPIIARNENKMFSLCVSYYTNESVQRWVCMPWLLLTWKWKFLLASLVSGLSLPFPLGAGRGLKSSTHFLY